MKIFFVTILSILVNAQPNFGPPIATDTPSFYPVNRNFFLPNPREQYWNFEKAPFPTGTFFTNAVIEPKADNESEPVQAFPYIYTFRPKGFSVSALEPELNADSTTQWQRWRPLFKIDGQFENRTITSYESLSFVNEWFSKENGNRLTVPVVLGSPFVTMNYTGGDPLNIIIFNDLQISTINGYNITTADNGRIFAGYKITIRFIDNSPTGGGKISEWVFYSLTEKIEFTLVTVAYGKDPTKFQITYKGNYLVLRLAHIGVGTNSSIFESTKEIISSKGTVSVSLDSDTHGILTYKWWPVNFMGKPSPQGHFLLMTALPHHMDVIQKPSKTTVPLFRTVRGFMYGIIGSNWTMIEKFGNISWRAPRPIEKSKARDIYNALQRESKGFDFGTISNDTYFFGKYVGALARMVLIADELRENSDLPSDRDALFNKVLKTLTDTISPWIGGGSFFNTFLYDRTWGGLISSNSWIPRREPPDGHFNYSVLLDYGNSIYNDHHYHNGYFIYGAAVVLKFNPSWGLKRRVIDLIRDVANPSSEDKFFPVTRMKDWFVGHSWSQGFSRIADGKDQESSSEAINCYYGIYLVGKAIDSPYLTRWGRFLLDTEIRSTKKYFHMMPNSDIYFPPFAKLGVIGIMFQMKVDYRIWWGSIGDNVSRVEHIHAIQMMPFTPITEEYLSPIRWVEYEYHLVKTAFTRPSPPMDDTFRALIVEDMAILNREEAWIRAKRIASPKAFKEGNSRTNMYWWIATRSNNTLNVSFSSSWK